MAKDLTKISDHPENHEIVKKLLNGDSPKVVSHYLKDKYPNPDQAHLRVTATMLQEFLEKYADHHQYVKNIVQNSAESKMEKRIHASLLDNRAYRERVADGVGKEINYMDRMDNILNILEIRAEQVFDMIQADPMGKNPDYVFTKYMELLMMAIEKGDKMRNDRPDVKIEHTYTVQMVEQQSVAFQEAIRKVLERLGPEYTGLFMEILNEEMGKLKANDINPAPPPTSKSVEKERRAIDKLDVNVQEFDQKFLEESNDDEDK